MIKRLLLFLFLCWLMVFSYDLLIGLPQAFFSEPVAETTHSHTFGQWSLQQESTCALAGTEQRSCADCQAVETRPIAPLPHTLKEDNICAVCRYAEFDRDAQVAEVGIFSNCFYPDNATANRVWDVKIWGDFVYRGAGDYDKNAGSVPFLAFNKATGRWEQFGSSADEAIQRFIEIDGTLYSPGIDPAESWSLGNFYVLEGESWKKVRTLPNGLHNFDMIAFDGKLFAGLGTEALGNTVAVSDDKGASWTFVPLYRDGAVFDTAGYEYSRTYAFAQYGGSLYALVQFKISGVYRYDSFIFRYTDGKMEYQSAAGGTLTGATGRNVWQGTVEWKGVCYLTSTQLNAITDFSDPRTHRQIPMPNGEVVSDILLYEDRLYVLSFTFLEDMTFRVTIYQSATGEEGSFTAVASFNYPALPMSFDFDGAHFYIGTGNCPTDSAKVGMLLRVKPGT